jgi:hypothetical protein
LFEKWYPVIFITLLQKKGTGNREQGTDKKHSFAEFRTSVKKKMFLKDA